MLKLVRMLFAAVIESVGYNIQNNASHASLVVADKI